jgi:hypothetical protein
MSKGFHKTNWSKRETSPSLNNLNRPLTDREFQIAVAQQQSAYAAPATRSTEQFKQSESPATPLALSTISKPATKNDKDGKRLTVKRSGGGKSWEDPSLLEWNPDHFRLFVGNLSGEVTDEMLTSAFGKYASVSKVKAVIDARTERCKGFGFVSFADADDYFRAFKELNGKYIGNHPIQLKKATTEIKTVGAKNRRKPYSRQ